MSDVFISYARSTEPQAKQIAEALRALGYGVWRDDELPAHRAFAEVIEERLKAAKAVVVVWSAEAAKSHWVQSEANRAREDAKLVQLSIDGAKPPMPFDRIECADMRGWAGEANAPGWTKVAASVAQLVSAAVAPQGLAVVAPTLALPDAPSIAVLPFENLSGDPEQAYFSDGMVVEIITALSRFPSLFVIASGSSLAYRDPALKRGQVAAELGVRYLLEGSVRKAGERVRIAVQLVEAAKSTQLWADRFDGNLLDVFALQDTVANAVASQIEPTIKAAEIRRANARPTENLSAYDCYLRALPHCQRFDKPSFGRALDFFDEAIARDPDYALALATAASVRATRMMWGWSERPDNDRRLALDHRSRALQLAPDDPEVLGRTSMAGVMLGLDILTAEAEVDRALARNRGSASAWMCSGMVHLLAGRSDIALAELESSLLLDPRSTWRPIILVATSDALFFQKRFDESLRIGRQACDLLPALAESYAPYMASTLAHLGRIAEARTLAKVTSLDLVQDNLDRLAPADRETFLSGWALATAEV